MYWSCNHVTHEKAVHVACTGHVTHEKSAVAVHVACTGHVTHEKSAVAVHVACIGHVTHEKAVHVACTGHVTHEKSAVAVHVACNRVLVMYPMKKITVVVDSIAYILDHACNCSNHPRVKVTHSFISTHSFVQ